MVKDTHAAFRTQLYQQFFAFKAQIPSRKRKTTVDLPKCQLDASQPHNLVRRDIHLRTSCTWCLYTKSKRQRGPNCAKMPASSLTYLFVGHVRSPYAELPLGGHVGESSIQWKTLYNGPYFLI